MKQESERFAPQVCVDGYTVAPPGWMWILGMALAGCDWAIKEADKPEFKAEIIHWMRERKIAVVEAQIEELEERLAALREG